MKANRNNYRRHKEYRRDQPVHYRLCVLSGIPCFRVPCLPDLAIRVFARLNPAYLGAVIHERNISYQFDAGAKSPGPLNLERMAVNQRRNSLCNELLETIYEFIFAG